MEFLAKHGKTYATKSHLSTRYDIFAQNYRAIQEHNRNNAHYQMEVNKFADLSPEEFGELYLSAGVALPTPDRRASHHRRPRLGLALDDATQPPETVDWRQAGKVTVPGD
jgi:hypothetical protein